MKKERMNNKGFSLVELIIVIAIMAVLIGVLAPQYLKYVNKSKVSTDITNAEEIANAVNVAIADGQLTTGGTITGVGGTAVTGIDNLSKLPTSSVDSSQSWEVTYTVKDGVTSIKLGGTVIYPDPSAYQTAH